MMPPAKSDVAAWTSPRKCHRRRTTPHARTRVPLPDPRQARRAPTLHRRAMTILDFLRPNTYFGDRELPDRRSRLGWI